jgi:hypothetical protein
VELMYRFSGPTVFSGLAGDDAGALFNVPFIRLFGGVAAKVLKGLAGNPHVTDAARPLQQTPGTKAINRLLTHPKRLRRFSGGEHEARRCRGTIVVVPYHC